MTEMAPEWTRTASLPALLRAAWSAYGSAVRHALAEAGFDDVPRNGSYVLGAVAAPGAPLSGVVARLGVSKQAASQLVDTLVLRGYLERSVDPADRRRLIVTLTERGAAAAAAIRSAVDLMDGELAARAGAERVAHTRAVLAMLAEPGAGDA